MNKQKLLDKIDEIESLGCEVPDEFFDFLDIVLMGARKYAPNNWLKPDGKRSSHKENHDSMFHHLAESYSGLKVDKESGQNPKLHLATRVLMGYTREKRGIIHPDDKE